MEQPHGVLDLIWIKNRPLGPMEIMCRERGGMRAVARVVYYRTIHPVGTIVIAKSQGHLYLVRPNVAAVRYTIGVGRECTNAVGLLLVSAKEQHPENRPAVAAATPVSARSPANVGAKQHGSRAVALGDTGLRIYGTDPPVSDGKAGCFALTDEDMTDLYERIAVGARVVIS